MHERNDKLTQIEVLKENLEEFKKDSAKSDADSIEMKEIILRYVMVNNETLRLLVAEKNKGPRHTACDTKQILEDWRAGKLQDHYLVEDRCQPDK